MNGTIKLLDSALEYKGGGIIAGTDTIIPAQEPSTLELLLCGEGFLVQCAMREKPKLSLIALLLCVFASSAEAQGTFQNLNFESANVAGAMRGSDIPIGSGMPNWNAIGTSPTLGTLPATQVTYDGLALSQSILAINDQNTGFGFEPLQGSFSAYICGGEGFSISLQQTGMVPFGTKSLLVDVQTSALTLITSLGGQTITMIPVSQNANYTVYGGDISSFAGQVEQLSFTEPNSPSLLVATIDDIVFSPNAIPEPSTWALLLCGVGFFGLMHHARKAKA